MCHKSEARYWLKCIAAGLPTSLTACVLSALACNVPGNDAANILLPWGLVPAEASASSSIFRKFFFLL